MCYCYGIKCDFCFWGRFRTLTEWCIIFSCAPKSSQNFRDRFARSFIFHSDFLRVGRLYSIIFPFLGLPPPMNFLESATDHYTFHQAYSTSYQDISIPIKLCKYSLFDCSFVTQIGFAARGDKLRGNLRW